jgi:hypothetical protein
LLLIRGSLAALRQVFHLTNCPNLASHLSFAWEDKFKRLLLRFEFKQQRHYGMKLMAFTLINLRPFCGA